MSDLKRCREAFDKYVKDFPETRHDYGAFVAGWISRRADDDWRPIETAPKDGTLFQMRCSFIFKAEYRNNDLYMIDSLSMKQIQEWHPLPDPPRKDDGHE
jgi:hypothetical protein